MDASHPPYPPGAPFAPWFVDATGDSGVVADHVPDLTDPFSEFFGDGVAVGDVDGDGQLDLLAPRGQAPVALFRNVGGLVFEDITGSSGFDAQLRANGAALGDLDGDGDLDAVLVGARSLKLYWNTGDGTFTDGTAAAGIPAIGNAQGVLLVDIDTDGLIDIYAPGYVDSYLPTPTGSSDRLLRNNGDGSFIDIVDRVGLEQRGYSWVAAAFDYDGDGDGDLYVGNDTFIQDSGTRPLTPAQADILTDLLYRNDGPGADGYPVFTEIGAAAGVDEPRATMGIIAQDISGDGVPDVYLSDFGRNELMAGRGDGTFEDRTDAAGVGAIFRLDPSCAEPEGKLCHLVSWGSAFEDLDLDGMGDLVVANGHLFGGLEAKEEPAAVWRGAAGGALEPVQTALGWMAARALIAADLDGDGDLDLVVTTWAGPVRIFANDSVGGGWLRVRLRGRASNPDGLGTVVIATLSDGRTLRREVGVGGLVHSWAPAEAHFGLGSVDVTGLQILWPSGFLQTVGPVERDQLITVTEPQLVRLSARTAAGDGVSTIEVVVEPSAADGSALGPGHVVQIRASVGTWSGPVADGGDGTYARTLRAPLSPALAVVSVGIDGVELRVHPRILFR